MSSPHLQRAQHCFFFIPSRVQFKKVYISSSTISPGELFHQDGTRDTCAHLVQRSPTSIGVIPAGGIRTGAGKHCIRNHYFLYLFMHVIFKDFLISRIYTFWEINKHDSQGHEKSRDRIHNLLTERELG